MEGHRQQAIRCKCWSTGLLVFSEVFFLAASNSGSEIVKELLSRGHKITGVARNVDSLKAKQGVTAKTDDLSNVDSIAAIIEGAAANGQRV